MKKIPVLVFFIMSAGLLLSPITAFAQDTEWTNCPYCNRTVDQVLAYGHATNCPLYVSLKPPAPAPTYTPSQPTSANQGQVGTSTSKCPYCYRTSRQINQFGHALGCPSYVSQRMPTSGYTYSLPRPESASERQARLNREFAQKLEQQAAQGIANLLVGLIFPKKQDTSRQDEIDRQNAIKIKQAEEMEKQQQLQLQQEQELARQKKFAEEKGQLLGAFKDTSLPSSELKLKTATDFFQSDAVDLRVKQGIVGSLKTSEEQAEFEESPAVWKEKQGELIQQRLEEPNQWCSGIQSHLMGNVPPLPDKTFNELQPGDVLLLEGKIIAGIDNKFTSDKASDSAASHTVIFLKEVNGKKYFLDNQPAPVNGGKGGPRIITDAEFLDTYGHRGAEVARLVGQPLNKEEGDRLLHAALEMAEKNRKKIANNFLGSGYFGTNYGVKGEDMVCSESDWALLNLAREKQIPKSGDQTKVEWGINWSPADFRNQQYFLVTPLIMPK